MVFRYAAMVAFPILMLLSLLSILLYGAQSVMYSSLMILVAIDLFVLGLLGFLEVYIHKKGAGERVASVATKSLQSKKEKRFSGGSNVTVSVRRFNPKSQRLEESKYTLAVGRFTTALAALLHIRDSYDNTLAVRYSCRMGICGSCGVVINGKPSLACETRILNEAKNGNVSISPMLAHPVLKDLVTDFDDFLKKHESVDPVLIRKNNKEKMEAKNLYDQDSASIKRFLPYSYCIMCGLCMDACPVVNSNPEFIGPQSLSQVYRYHADSRDQGGSSRTNLVDSLSGAWGCEFAGECSKVCPAGVDPATAIQLLKSDIMKGRIIKSD